MLDMPFEIQQREVEGIAILDIKGRLVLGHTDAELRQTLQSLLGAGKNKVIINLRDVSNIDTASIGSLILSQQKFESAGGRLVLVNLLPTHASVDEVLKLDTAFATYQDELTAVNSFFPERAVPRYDLLEFLEEEAHRHDGHNEPESKPA